MNDHEQSSTSDDEDVDDGRLLPNAKVILTQMRFMAVDLSAGDGAAAARNEDIAAFMVLTETVLSSLVLIIEDLEKRLMSHAHSRRAA